MTRATGPVVIWSIEDGKPGHRSQQAGLVTALAEYRELREYRLPARQAAAGLPAPDLILAAGRRTHRRALWARWRHGGRLVVLMRPTLPLGLFDLCLIPAHDGVAPSSRVLLTRGPLNPVRPSTDALASCGLILLGGPCRHYHWSDSGLVNQIRRLRSALPGQRWTVVSSRRTPARLTAMIAALGDPQLQLAPAAAQAPGWLLEQYARAAVIWVTEDSASMVYESLSSGASVGLLGLASRRAGRLSRGMAALLASGLLTDLDTVTATGTMPPPAPPLQEAARAARQLLAWLEQGQLPTAADA